MLYAVLFEDDARHAQERARHLSAHLAFLAAHATSIRAAGPLTDTVGRAPAGGLWTVEARDPAGVRALIEADPFWPTGLRKSVRVLEWTQVFADGKARG